LVFQQRDLRFASRSILGHVAGSNIKDIAVGDFEQHAVFVKGNVIANLPTGVSGAAYAINKNGVACTYPLRSL
jgi:hypothetical protein